MNDVRKIDLRRTGAWLSGEIEIRVRKSWLAGGGLALLALLIVALE